MRGLWAVWLAVASTWAWGSDVFGDGDEPAKPRIRPIPPLAAGPAPLGLLPASLRERALEVRDRPLGERIRAVSDSLVGLPYKLDGLGEGQGHDPDPLARYDAYDCIGLVEEALALALAGDPEHAAEVRNRLRYGAGPVDYAHRRHFMELQWLPGNVADGFIEATSSRYGEVAHLERTVDADTWRRWRKRPQFALTDEQLPLGVMSLDYLPLDVARAAVDRLPEGALVLTVRKDNGGPIWISHTGLVVIGEDGTVMQRNASRRHHMRVVDEPLVKYLDYLAAPNRWPAVGIAIYEPIEQLPRRSALTPTP